MTENLSPKQKQALIEHLSVFVSDERKGRFDAILNARLDHMHIILEDVYQAHNASAVLRSADCFGIQHVHFVEEKNHYKVSQDVALGASQWLTIHRHKNTKEAITELKEKGFKIVATTPHENNKTIFDVDVSKKIALIFGTEIGGITKEVYDLADEFVKIPMYGFTESFNISVSAALCMHELSHKIRKEVKEPFLSAEEKQSLYLEWLVQSIRKCDLIIKDFLAKNPV